MIRLPNETPEPEELKPEEAEEEEFPEIKPEDWIIVIPAKLKGSSSIQRMANDLIERIKVEGKRLDESKI